MLEGEKLLGIDIGGTKTAVLLANADMSDRQRIEFPTNTHQGPEQAIANIIKTAEKMITASGCTTDTLVGIGVSCGGPLDSTQGIIQSPPNLPGWDDIHIVDILSTHFGKPARLQNDANACALAEWRYGSGKGTSNFVFLTFGTGMGAGIIAGKQLLEGANGNGGEVGHIRLAPHGPVGYGKAGSFEGFCSGGGIAQLAQVEARKRLAKGQVVGFCNDESSIPSITTRDVAEAASKGDITARRILKVSGQRLGMGLSLLIDILNPEVIAIGSIFRRCHEHLWPYAKGVIEKEALSQSASVCRVVPAHLGEEIGDYACLGLAVLASEM